MALLENINKFIYGDKPITKKKEKKQLINSGQYAGSSQGVRDFLNKIFSGGQSTKRTPPANYSGFTPEKMGNIFGEGGSTGNILTDVYGNLIAPIAGANQILPTTREQAQEQRAQRITQQVANAQPAQQPIPQQTQQQITPQVPDLSSLEAQLQKAQEMAAQLSQQVQAITQKREPEIPTANINIADNLEETIPVGGGEEKTTFGDLQRLLNEQAELRKQLISAMTPTEKEIELENQLANLRANASLGLEQERNRIAPMALITGRQEALQRQAAIQEQLLLDRLGLEQKKRQTKLGALKTALGFGKEDIDLTLRIQDALANQEANIMSQIDKLSDNARSTLSTILNQFKGLDFNELPETAQAELIQTAQTAGFPVGTLVAGMKHNKDLELFRQQMDILKAQEGVGSQSDIEAYAREYRRGNLLPTDIPQKIRGTVLNIVDTYGKQFDIEDLQDDISKFIANGLNKREIIDTITTLKKSGQDPYPEITEKEVRELIDEMLPEEEEEEEPGGIIGFFSKLF